MCTKHKNSSCSSMHKNDDDDVLNILVYSSTIKGNGHTRRRDELAQFVMGNENGQNKPPKLYSPSPSPSPTPTPSRGVELGGGLFCPFSFPMTNCETSSSLLLVCPKGNRKVAHSFFDNRIFRQLFILGACSTEKRFWVYLSALFFRQPNFSTTFHLGLRQHEVCQKNSN